MAKTEVNPLLDKCVCVRLCNTVYSNGLIVQVPEINHDDHASCCWLRLLTACTQDGSGSEPAARWITAMPPRDLLILASELRLWVFGEESPLTRKSQPRVLPKLGLPPCDPPSPLSRVSLDCFLMQRRLPVKNGPVSAFLISPAGNIFSASIPTVLPQRLPHVASSFVLVPLFVSSASPATPLCLDFRGHVHLSLLYYVVFWIIPFTHEPWLRQS